MELYELRNFMNTWSQEEQQQQELHESFVNRLYECKPVKSKGSNKRSVPIDRTVSSNWHQRVDHIL